jgi:c-di-GMP-binding flagellar brake protein YcgR
MLNFDQIEGKSVRDTLSEVQDNHTLLRLILRGTDYSSMTVITELRRRLNGWYLLVGAPEGFAEAVRGKKDWKLEFEYTGPDRIQYRFTTNGGDIDGDQLRIPLPDRIHRNQRRQHFRINAPEGTHLTFRAGDNEYRQLVVDISLGGALISLKPPNALKVGDVLQDIVLSFPGDSEDSSIQIQSAKIVRIENRTSVHRTRCGLQFAEIEMVQSKILTTFIFEYQRKFLRNRVRPDL